MKKIKILTIILIATLVVTSCTKDAEENLPGTWNTSDGGTVTFNTDGTAFTVGSDFFTFDCGTLNGVFLGPYTDFEWMITEDGNNLFMAFESDSTNTTGGCSGSTEQPIKVKSKNKAIVGKVVFGLGTEIELTR